MKANIYTGAVQFINIYNYHDVKLKVFFIYLYIYVYMLEQYKATVSYMVMAWTVINTVSHHSHNKVDNKLSSGLTDPQMHVLLLHILVGWVQAIICLWTAVYKPLGVSTPQEKHWNDATLSF